MKSKTVGPITVTVIPRFKNIWLMYLGIKLKLPYRWLFRIVRGSVYVA